jgi:mono/diheme cytochrome c family protein
MNTMRGSILAPVLVVVLGAAACEIERRPEARTETAEVTRAEERYDPVTFDTVVWASQEAAVERGRDIYTWVCADCHGPEGRGDGGRVIEGDTIRPPSFQRDDWPYADDPEELHRKVFIGNTLGMPHWGLRLMRPRDIVALEQYIRLDLVGEER